MLLDGLSDWRAWRVADRREPHNRSGPYFAALSADWSEGVRRVFRELPDLKW